MTHFDLVVKGLFAGLLISVMVGPIFFGLIQLALERSVRAALIYASGIWLSDLVYVRLVQTGLGYISDIPNFRLIFGTVGALLLVAFGLGIYFSPLRKKAFNKEGASTLMGYFLQGVAINVFNPFVFILWFSLLSNVSHEAAHHQWIFVGTLLSIVVITDIIKAYSAHKIGRMMTDSNLIKVKKLSGVLLGVFGLVLFVRTLLITG